MSGGFFEDYKGRAVLIRGGGVPDLCLVELEYDGGDAWKMLRGLPQPYAYPTKEEAIRSIAKPQRIDYRNVQKLHGPLGFRPWVIRWDLRYTYFVAPNWDYETTRNIILSCKELRHSWKNDGWCCDNCGKLKQDLEPYKQMTWGLPVTAVKDAQ